MSSLPQLTPGNLFSDDGFDHVKERNLWGRTGRVEIVDDKGKVVPGFGKEIAGLDFRFRTDFRILMENYTPPKAHVEILGLSSEKIDQLCLFASGATYQEKQKYRVRVYAGYRDWTKDGDDDYGDLIIDLPIWSAVPTTPPDRWVRMESAFGYSSNDVKTATYNRTYKKQMLSRLRSQIIPKDERMAFSTAIGDVPLDVQAASVLKWWHNNVVNFYDGGGRDFEVLDNGDYEFIGYELVPRMYSKKDILRDFCDAYGIRLVPMNGVENTNAWMTGKVDQFTFSGGINSNLQQIKDIFPNFGFVLETDNSDNEEIVPVLKVYPTDEMKERMVVRHINMDTGMIGIPSVVFGYIDRNDRAVGSVRFTTLLDTKIRNGDVVEIFSRNYPAVSGQYQVYSLSHNGHLRGNEWYSVIECRNPGVLMDRS